MPLPTLPPIDTEDYARYRTTQLRRASSRELLERARAIPPPAYRGPPEPQPAPLGGQPTPAEPPPVAPALPAPTPGAPPADEGQLAVSPVPGKGANGWVFPVADYGGQVQLHWGKHPGGADLFAPPGTPVRAAVGGKVLAASFEPNGGNNVIIQGDDGQQYYYAHLAEAPLVARGQQIPAGTVLGGVGDTGNAKGTGAHLHFGAGKKISTGTGPAGGTGTDFDAVGALQAALTPAPASGPVGPSAAQVPTARHAETDEGLAAQKYGLDPDIFFRQISQESGGRANAVSPAGARGVGQFMPGTAQAVAARMGGGVTAEQIMSDKAIGLDAAAFHLREMLDQYGGDYATALASYNAGPGAVAKYGGVPPFKETQTYIQRILGDERPTAEPMAQPMAGVAPAQAPAMAQPMAGVAPAQAPAMAQPMAPTRTYASPREQLADLATRYGQGAPAGDFAAGAEAQLADLGRRYGLPQMVPSAARNVAPPAAAVPDYLGLATAQLAETQRARAERAYVAPPPEPEPEPVYVPEPLAPEPELIEGIPRAALESYDQPTAVTGPPSGFGLTGDVDRGIGLEPSPPSLPEPTWAEQRQAAFPQPPLPEALPPPVEPPFIPPEPVELPPPIPFPETTISAAPEPSYTGPGAGVPVLGGVAEGVGTAASALGRFGRTIVPDVRQRILESGGDPDAPEVREAVEYAQRQANLGTATILGPISVAGGPTAAAIGAASELGALAAPGVIRGFGGTEEQAQIGGGIAGVAPAAPGLVGAGIAAARAVPAVARAARSPAERLGNALLDAFREAQSPPAAVVPEAAETVAPVARAVPQVAEEVAQAVPVAPIREALEAVPAPAPAAAAPVVGKPQSYDYILNIPVSVPGGDTLYVRAHRPRSGGAGTPRVNPKSAEAVWSVETRTVGSTANEELARGLTRPEAIARAKDHLAQAVPPPPVTRAAGEEAVTQRPALSPVTGALLGGSASQQGTTEETSGTERLTRALLGFGVGSAAGAKLRGRPAAGAPLTRGAALRRQTQEMWANEVRPPVLDQVRDVLRMIERKGADSYADINRVSPRVEQAAALFRGRGPRIEQRIEQDVDPVFKLIGNDEGYLNEYIKYQRDKEVANLPAFAGKDRLFSAGIRNAGDADEALADLAAELGPERYARLEQADALRTDAISRLLDDRVAEGLIPEELAAHLKASQPHYNPTRQLSVADVLPGRGARFTVNSNNLRRLTEHGHEGDTMPPLTAFAQAIVEGEGAIQKQRVVSPLIDDLIATGVPGVKKLPNVQLRTGTGEQAGEMVTIAGRRPPVDVPGAISRFKDGSRELWEVPPDIERTVKNLDQEQVGAIGKIFGAMNAVTRAGLTAVSPYFTPINILADAGITAFSAGGKTAARIPLGWWHAARKDALYQDFIMHGGGSSGFWAKTPEEIVGRLRRNGGRYVNGPREVLQEVGKDLAAGAVGGGLAAATNDPNDPNYWWKVAAQAGGVGAGRRALLRVNEIAEQGPRLARYEAGLARGETPQAAALGGRRVTIDFQRMGEMVRALNPAMLFLGAQVGGSLAPFRALRNDPATKWRAAGVAAAAAGLYYWNRQFPAYKEILQDFRDQFGIVMLPGAVTNEQGNVVIEGTDKPGYMAFPLRELALFTAPVTYALAKLDQQDPRRVDEAARDFIKTYTPGLPRGEVAGGVLSSVPAVPKTAAEIGLNTSFFTGRPIVPGSLEGVPREEQVTERTSAFATSPFGRRMGDALGYSPIQLDYAIRGVGGTAAQALLDLGKPTGGVPVLPGVAGRVFRSYGGQTREDQEKELDRLYSELRPGMVELVHRAPGYAEAPRDRQLQLLRSAETALRDELTERVGIISRTKDLGLPERFFGVPPGSPVEADIARALAKSAKDRTPAEQALAAVYNGLRNPAYQPAAAGARSESEAVREAARALTR